VIYLRSVRKTGGGAGYPLGIPLLQGLSRLAFEAPVTLLCGDNGSGKTTLMELLAALSRAVRIDGGRADKARAFQAAAGAFGVEWSRRPARSFFFQAEDFIRYIDGLHALKADARAAIAEAEQAYADPYARSLATMPHHRTLAEIEARYQGDLDAQSHGESFLAFFGARIVRGGLYLLDEPEAALSPANQLVLLHLIADAQAQGCQLIISTHSPVLLAYPGACLCELQSGQIAQTPYEELESIRFLQSFLSDVKGFTGRIKP
jgi:predicted ATPase